MYVLERKKPEKVFRFFEEICRIPHGSGNTKALSDYCVTFAKERGLACWQDRHNNIVIYKKGSAGSQQAAPVIIQGHLDMVCEREADREIDFTKEGLQLFVEGDFVRARGTTLGGDDGIAVAMALAILDDDTLVHPPLEVVFTVDEEIGMLGAAAMDAGVLRGRTLLNLDSEEEGHFLVGCAGGMTATCHLPLERGQWRGVPAAVRVRGLAGGHSGVEIDKEGANANVLLGRVLYALKKRTHFTLLHVEGGLKDNAIPRSAGAVLMLAPGDEAAFLEEVKRQEAQLIAEYRKTDAPILEGTLSLSASEEALIENRLPFSEGSTAAVITALRCLPSGVQRRSPDIEGLVQTSLNPGILETTDEAVRLTYSVRSSVASEKEALFEKLECLTEALGGTVTRAGDYPAWEYKEEAPLRELMGEVYREMYKKEPVMEVIHAGVECGLFSEKLPGLDCVSYGPDIFDIHTPKERLSVSSTERVYAYTLEVLRRLAKWE